MEPTVSIIMGIYNCQNTLAEAIESILSQTLSDWLLIMCDDGSTDNTFDIAEEYRNRYPDRIKLIRNKNNMGLSYTLNKCLNLVETDFVARMDGDDISLNTRLEEEINFLNNHPEYDIVSTQVIYFNESGEFAKSSAIHEPSINSMCRFTPFCHGSCMIRTNALKSISGYDESNNKKRVEDWDLWIRMYEKGFCGYRLPRYLYKFRENDNSINKRKFKYRINETRVSIEAVKKLKLNPIYYIFCLRPIIVGILPKSVYRILHRIRFKIVAKKNDN